MSDNNENDIGEFDDIYGNKSINSEKTYYPYSTKDNTGKYIVYPPAKMRYPIKSGNTKEMILNNQQHYNDLKEAFKDKNNIKNDQDPRLKKFKEYTRGPGFSGVFSNIFGLNNNNIVVGGRRKSKKTKRKSLKKRRKTKRKSLKKRRRTRRR